jgi:hypothetical protein
MKPFAEVIRQVGDAALKEVLEDLNREEKTIVDDEAFAGYAYPKKTTVQKNKPRSKPTKKA